MRTLALFALLGGLGSQAAAEVRSSNANGFEVEQRVELPIPPRALYNLFGDIPRWWSDAHTYSGKAANLSLALTPGGCWCEKLPGGGGVEHMRVAFVEPGKRVVLTGSLGPLLAEATSGVMQVVIAPTTQGSSLTLNYRASGFYNGGAPKLASLVDQVLAAQVRRIGQQAAAPKP